jgi:Transposase DDE domain
VISTVDPDTRHAHTSVQRRQDGFKAHLAIEPDTGIITDCVLTKAGGLAIDGVPVSDARTGLALLDGEDSPVRVLADSAYGSGEFRAELLERGHVVWSNPPRPARLSRPGSPSMTSPSTTRTAPQPVPTD